MNLIEFVEKLKSLPRYKFIESNPSECILVKDIDKLLKLLDVNITTYSVITCMGHFQKGYELPFLSEEQIEEFNTIGCSGKLNGIKISFETYLNSLGIGHFKVNKTKTNYGDFCEEYLITKVN
jgi:hypothetical protein